MPNDELPKPEFRVDCVMCDTSFSATVDTLKELVEIVALHLRQVKEAKYEPHKKYLAKHTDMKEHMASLEKNYPESAAAILSSPAFSWAIERLVPFNEIFKLFKIEPFPLLEPTLTH